MIIFTLDNVHSIINVSFFLSSLDRFVEKVPTFTKTFPSTSGATGYKRQSLALKFSNFGRGFVYVTVLCSFPPLSSTQALPSFFLFPRWRLNLNSFLYSQFSYWPRWNCAFRAFKTFKKKLKWLLQSTSTWPDTAAYWIVPLVWLIHIIHFSSGYLKYINTFYIIYERA